MKKCPFCAEDVQDQAIKCKHCGSSFENSSSVKNSGVVLASQHDQYKMLTLLCLIIPAVGILIGIVYLTKESKIDKKLGEHCISWGILSVMLWGALWMTYSFFYLG